MKFSIHDQNSQMGVIEYIGKLDIRKRHEVDITRKREKRTLPQNSLYWLYLTCIATENGGTKNSYHIHFTETYLLKGEVKFGNKVVKEYYSTTELDTKQFTDLLHNVVAEAAEAGTILPDPADLIWEQFYERYKDLV